MIRKSLKRLFNVARQKAKPSPTRAPRPRSEPNPSPRHAAPRAEEEEDEGPNLEVDAAGVSAWLAEGLNVVWLDVREPHELRYGYVDGAAILPMNSIPSRLSEVPRADRLVVYCAAGMRSFGVATYLREQGIDEAWSLSGGFPDAEEAGGTTIRPPAGAKYLVATPVRVTRDALEVDGAPVQEDQRSGRVRRVRPGEHGAVYDVELMIDGKSVLIDGLDETELERPRTKL